MTDSTAPNTLVLAIGSRERGDDGAGPAVIALLRKMRLPAGVDLLELWGDGTEIMQAWQGYGRVIVVDASCSSVPAGTVRRIDAATENLEDGLFHVSTHEFGLTQAVEMARSLGELPDELVLYAVEGQRFDHGTSLCDAVRQAVSIVADEIGDYLRQRCYPTGNNIPAVQPPDHIG